MRRALDLFGRALSRVAHRFSNFGQGVLMVMVLLVVVDIILRRFFNSPLPWSLEIVEIMLVVVVFFSVAYCGVKDGHVSIDVLTSRFPPRLQAALDSVTSLLGMALFGFMAWGSIMSGLKFVATNRVTGILPIPIYPFAFTVALGSALLALVLLVRLFNSIGNVVKHA